LQTRKTFGDETLAPLADGMAVAVEFGGDVLIGGVVGPGGTQDDAAAKDQGLRRGTGANQTFELRANLRCQFNWGSEGAWHGCPPWLRHKIDCLGNFIATHAHADYTTGSEFMKRTSSEERTGESRSGEA
jgi:hypothetical protein